MSTIPKYGLYVPFVSKPTTGSDVAGFLDTGYGLSQDEPDTIQWFALKYSGITPETFAVFDTFHTTEGRSAHLAGKIAQAIGEHGPTLFAKSPEIAEVEVLASKVKPTSSDKTCGLANGLSVMFTAKEDKVEAVKQFLIGALPLVEAEPDTPVWYAVHLQGTNMFGIVDFFASEDGRNTHLGGKVAAALFASVDELLTGAPNVVKVEVLAAKIVV